MKQDAQYIGWPLQYRFLNYCPNFAWCCFQGICLCLVWTCCLIMPLSCTGLAMTLPKSLRRIWTSPPIAKQCPDTPRLDIACHFPQWQMQNIMLLQRAKLYSKRGCSQETFYLTWGLTFYERESSDSWKKCFAKAWTPWNWKYIKGSWVAICPGYNTNSNLGREFDSKTSECSFLL